MMTAWEERPAIQREQAESGIQSMRGYLLRHHWPLVLGGLEDWLRREGLSPVCGFPLTEADCRLTGMTFRRWDAGTLLAEVTVSLRLGAGEQIGICPAYCELWIDMRRGMNAGCGECGCLADRPQRALWLLNEYLLPVLRREEIEQGAEELLARYCPEALLAPGDGHAHTLARRMGLQILYLPLHQRKGTRSILFFRAGRVLTAQEEGGVPRLVRIPAGTILLNTGVARRDQCQLDILHECIHYDWHFMFFRLQAMHRSDLRRMKRRCTGDSPAEPLAWMEWQARRGSCALLMPRSLVAPMVKRLQEHLAGSPLHAGRRYDWICRRMAEKARWPRFRVRARLIQLGHVEARGALNYVDGAYIEPFAFRREQGAGDATFVIDRQGVLELYEREEAFRQLLESGEWVYADGHICRSGAEFIRRTAGGLRLTPWANAHVDRCCLRFLRRYEAGEASPCRLGEMHSDEEYNRQYLAYAGAAQAFSRARMDDMARLLRELPPSFPEALTCLMRRAHVTIEQLEERAFISARTISRLRTEERSEYALDQVIALCVALHLPPWLSRELLRRAGFSLRQSGQHLAYQCILDCMFMDEVADVQRFLEGAGLPRLHLNDQ